MSRTAVPPSLAAIDRRTLLARAKDELTESESLHNPFRAGLLPHS